MTSTCAALPLIYAGLIFLLITLLALTAVFSSKPTRRKAAAEILRLLLHRDPSSKPPRSRTPNP